jgi:hypothetical protein
MATPQKLATQVTQDEEKQNNTASEFKTALKRNGWRCLDGINDQNSISN